MLQIDVIDTIFARVYDRSPQYSTLAYDIQSSELLMFLFQEHNANPKRQKYSFVWSNFRRPYSQELAEVIMGVKGSKEVQELNKAELQACDRMKAMLTTNKKNPSTDKQWLMALAGLLYLKNCVYTRAHKRFIIGELMRLHPCMTDEALLDKAYEVLLKHYWLCNL